LALLPITIATGNYDRVKPLIDGQVKVEGCDVNYLVMNIEESGHRAFASREFDVTELSCSIYMVARSRDLDDYIAIPIFPSRSFRHSAIYIRDDRGISSPDDLRGRKVGVPVYSMTAALWVRGMLQQEYGVSPSQIEWFTGGLEQPGREEPHPLRLPADIKVSAIPPDRSLSEFLETGQLDALVTARAPLCFERRKPHIKRLFENYAAAEKDYYRRTRLFPIMHLLAVRKELAAAHPWLPSSLFKAFLQSKQLCIAELLDWTAAKVSAPWALAGLEETVALMGTDYWRYGFRENLPELQVMTRWSYEQGLSARLLKPEELFHPATLDQPRI
jgi:4,5-dihydroxyphthalate decarboxylase